MKKNLLLLMIMLAMASASVAQDVYSTGYYTYTKNGITQKAAALYKNGTTISNRQSIYNADLEGKDVLVATNGKVYWVYNNTTDDKAFVSNYTDSISIIYNEANARINAICEGDGYIYSVGQKKVNGVWKAAVWRDDQFFAFLGDGGYDFYATSACFKDGHLYTTVEYSAGYGSGSVWKDLEQLYQLGSGVTPRDVFVYDEDVYTTGFVQDFDTDAYVSKVWKNDEELYTLSPNATMLVSYAHSIYIDAGDIYVSGFDEEGHGKVWKNGVGLYTAGQSLNAVSANSSGVYSAGYVFDTIVHKWVGKIWKDGFAPYTPVACERINGMFVTEPECTNSAARPLPFYESFENGETDWPCWIKLDVDNSNNGQVSYWERSGTRLHSVPNGGNHCVRHTLNWDSNQEGWLISPKLALPSSNPSTLTFKTAESYYSDYTYEGVWISTTGTNPSNFTQVWTQSNPTGSWKTVTIDLSAYQGQNVYIGFKYTGIEGHDWYIDEVNVSDGWSPCETMSVPFVETFDTEIPSCWYIYNGDNTPSVCWNYYPLSSCAYHPVGMSNMPYQWGYLVSPNINLPAGGEYVLKFKTRTIMSSTSPTDMHNWICLQTDVTGTPDPSHYINQIWEDTEFSSSWTEVTVPLTGYAGHNITLSFNYSGAYTHEWFVDDVRVEEAYNITTNANPTIGGTITGGGYYGPNVNCILTAMPNEGWSFVNWTKGGVEVSTNPTYSFSVTESATYTANFSQNGTQVVYIGDGGTTTSGIIPTYSEMFYSLTEQIYTADEIGGTGLINGIAFYNERTEDSRTWDIYMAHTDKTSFTNKYDGILLTESDRVFSGSVAVVVNDWTWIIFDTPFSYNGTSNLVLAVDDNTGHSSGTDSMKFRTFNANNGYQVLYSLTGSSASTSPLTQTAYENAGNWKNQILLDVDRPYTYNITATANPTAGGTISIPNSVTYDFEDGTLQGWTAIDADNDENTWYNHIDENNVSHSGTGVATSASYINYVGPVTPDNWLVSPQMILGGSMSFWACGQDPSWASEHFAVYVSTSGNSISDFTQVLPETVATATMTKYTVDLGAYIGQTGYVAIRHFNCTDLFRLNVDDIEITSVSSSSSVSASYQQGSSCTLTATANEGYEFVNWTKDGEVVSTDAAYSFTVTESAEYVAHFEQVEIYIGDGGTATSTYLPTRATQRYYLSEQIYTANEIGASGIINSLSFYNDNNYDNISAFRVLDIYLAHTDKTAFEYGYDWIQVTEADLVFSGSVDFLLHQWTEITFDTPFLYDGTSNLVLVVDDNTGHSTELVYGLTFDTEAQQALCLGGNSGTNYDPLTSLIYVGTLYNKKNQIKLGGSFTPLSNITATANPTEGGTVGIPITYDFEDGTLQGWTNIDADGDGYGWIHGSASAGVYYSYYTHTSGHNSSGLVISGSYSQIGAQVLTPDNYLVSPQIALGGSISFWACAQDSEYAAEHFGVAVSTSGTNASDFQMISEWTIDAGGDRHEGLRGTRDQTTWTLYTADLSAYAGMTGYVAIRHFNCTDMFLLNVDDIEITSVTSSSVSASYQQGSTCTLTAIPNEGYEFVNWTKNGNVVSSTPTYSFTVTESAEYVANFEQGEMEIYIGDYGTAVNSGLPTCTTFAYSLSQQIYTADEIGTAGTIKSIAFFNNGLASTQTIELYMVNTVKESFADNTDWIAVTASDKVFSGDVTFVANDWTFITLDTPFAYDGTSNLAVIVDDNTGPREGVLFLSQFFVFGAIDKSIHVHSRETNFNPTAPTSYTGVRQNMKNQIRLGIIPSGEPLIVETLTITATADPVEGGTTSVIGNCHSGSTCALMASANPGYQFLNWTKNGTVVSSDRIYSFTVTENADFVAHFGQLQEISIGGDGTATNGGLPTITTKVYSLTQQIYTANEIGTAGEINSIAFFTNSIIGYSESRIIDLYMVNTSKETFADNTDWITVTASDLVFSGIVSFAEYGWTNITLDTPFAYNGTSNLAIITDDNTGYTAGCITSFRVFEANQMSIMDGSNDTDLNPMDPTDYSGVFSNTKNQILLGFVNNPTPHTITATANPTEGGTVTGGGTYNSGETCLLTATANTDYIFVNWTKDGNEVSTNATYSFEVTEDAEYVANFSLGVYIGDGNTTTTDANLPSSSMYNYSLTEQIYTADELGSGGTISSLAFYNSSSEKTRSYNVYMVHTAKAAFENMNDWIAVTPSDRVFSGSVTLIADGWTWVNFDTPFPYDGTSNIAVVVEDQTGDIGNGKNEMACLVFDADGNQAIRIYGDEAAFDPTAPAYNGVLMGVKNQIQIEFTNEPIITYSITATADPTEGGTVAGAGTYQSGQLCTLTATANTGYTFANWTKNNNEVSTSATYTFTVTEDADLVAHFTASEPGGDITQTTNFTTGWNWYSTYVEQNDIDGLAQLEESLGANGIQIKSQGQYLNYYEGMGWMGTLSNINNESSYKIKANAPCVINMTGAETTSSAHPITIGSGWNWIGYPVSTAMSIGEAMSGITPSNGDQLKSLNGYANYYEGMGWMGTLLTIEPGMGLLYNSTGSGSQTLVYPTGSKGGALAENVTPENNHWVPDLHAYPDNMTVTAVVELDDEELQSDSYELAAFANGECRGSVRLMYIEPIDRHIAFLTIAGEDVTTLSFSLYDAATDEEIHGANEQINFSDNAIVGSANEPYVIRFRSLTGMDEFGSRINVFPNPIARGEMLNITVPTEDLGKMQIEIINALGQVVEICHGASLQTVTAPQVAGVYTLRITVEGKGTYYRKLVVR